MIQQGSAQIAGSAAGAQGAATTPPPGQTPGDLARQAILNRLGVPDEDALAALVKAQREAEAAKNKTEKATAAEAEALRKQNEALLAQVRLHAVESGISNAARLASRDLQDPADTLRHFDAWMAEQIAEGRIAVGTEPKGATFDAFVAHLLEKRSYLFKPAGTAPPQQGLTTGPATQRGTDATAAAAGQQTQKKTEDMTSAEFQAYVAQQYGAQIH